jgi:hypothetical protein
VRLGRNVLPFVFIAALAMPTPAAAQQDVFAFLAGGAAGLGLHESGHAVLDLAFGVPPRVKKVTFGPLPFFAITHDAVSPRRELAISSAGFWVQEGVDELLLSHRSDDRPLRDRHAPFQKGLVAFGVLTSIGYASAALAESGPLERDTRGMAVSAGISERAVAGIIATPAVLDALRYYKPDAAWLRWASRASKIGGALLILKAER